MVDRLHALRDGFQDLVECVLGELETVRAENVVLTAQLDEARKALRDLVPLCREMRVENVAAPPVQQYVAPPVVAAPMEAMSFGKRPCKRCGVEYAKPARSSHICPACKEASRLHMSEVMKARQRRLTESLASV